MALEQLLRSKLSHDLRSKINVVLGYCDLVDDEFDEDAPARDDIATIRRACDELLLLNDEIRWLLKEERQSPEAGTRTFAELIAPALGKLEAIDGGSSLSFEGGNGPTLPAALEPVLTSLLLKTAYAFPAGVRVSAEAGERQLVVTLLPVQATVSSLESFASRYSATDAPDPRNDFDVYYLRETYAPGRLTTKSAVHRDASPPTVAITLGWE